MWSDQSFWSSRWQDFLLHGMLLGGISIIYYITSLVLLGYGQLIASCLILGGASGLSMLMLLTAWSRKLSVAVTWIISIFTMVTVVCVSYFFVSNVWAFLFYCPRDFGCYNHAWIYTGQFLVQIGLFCAALSLLTLANDQLELNDRFQAIDVAKNYSESLEQYSSKK